MILDQDYFKLKLHSLYILREKIIFRLRKDRNGNNDN